MPVRPTELRAHRAWAIPGKTSRKTSKKCINLDLRGSDEFGDIKSILAGKSMGTGVARAIPGWKGAVELL